jgi:hypothetical protein
VHPADRHRTRATRVHESGRRDNSIRKTSLLSFDQTISHSISQRCHPSDGDACCRVRRPSLRPAAHCPAPCSRWFGVQSKNHLGCHQNRGFCQQNRGFRQDGVPIAPPWWCLSHVSHVQQSALGLHCGDVQLKLCHFEFEGFDVSHYHTICINLPHFV